MDNIDVKMASVIILSNLITQIFPKQNIKYLCQNEIGECVMCQGEMNFDVKTILTFMFLAVVLIHI